MLNIKLFFWLKVLAIFGLMLGTYLMYEQITKPAWTPCTINATVNCDAVIKGEVSKTLGIPTPLYGLVGYAMILYGAIIKSKNLVLSMAAFGLVFCMYIAYVELFMLHVICPVCIGCQIDMIISFALAMMLKKSSDLV